MVFQTFPPPPQLKHVVKMFWAFELEGINGQPYVYRSMADGLAEMVFHYKGNFTEIEPHPLLNQSPAMLHAQTGKFRRFVTQENFGIFGAYIYPHALPQLFGHSSASLSDEMPDLQAILGRQGKMLESMVMEAKSNQERSRLLAEFLTRLLEKRNAAASINPHLIQRVIQLEGQMPIQQIMKEAGCSKRSLERHFKEMVGFSPKKFSRILRFQSVLKRYDGSKKDLAQLAYEFGYADQAHFSHDFKSFSGYTPGQYFHSHTEGIEYRE